MEGYIVQKMPPESEIPLYADARSDVEIPTPKTVIIPSTEDLRVNKRGKILSESENPNIDKLIPKEVVNLWGLQEGDFIVFNDPRDIISVNGETSPKITTSWPPISGPKALPGSYPTQPFPVEKYGNFNLRAATLLCPFGLGQSVYLASPGGAGKTTYLLDIWEAGLKLTKEISNLFMIAAVIGERTEDKTDYVRVMEKTEHSSARVEIHASPREDRLQNQVQMFDFVIKRARRLTSVGYHLVLLLDSVTRALMAHTRSEEINAGGGMISGGIRTSSIAHISHMLGVAGNFGDRSLTTISSVLLAAKGKTTSESAFTEETIDSATTAKLVLTGYPIPYPKLDVSETWARRVERFATNEQLKEMIHVKSLMWRNSPKASDAHRTLLGYCRENPIPEYYD